MDKPGYIKPPPGLIPAELTTPAPPPAPPSSPTGTSETVRLGERRPAMPMFVPSVPGAPPAAPASPPAPTRASPTIAPLSQPRNTDPQWRLTLHDGSVVHATGALLLGRDPGRVEGWQSASLVTINDPEKSVSKTHAAIETTGGEFWITDLHSTNGVAIFAADGTETVLEPDERFPVMTGSTIELGRYRVVVELG